MTENLQDKIKAAEGRLDGSEDLQKNLIPEIYVNSKLFESIFIYDYKKRSEFQSVF